MSASLILYNNVLCRGMLQPPPSLNGRTRADTAVQTLGGRNCGLTGNILRVLVPYHLFSDVTGPYKRRKHLGTQIFSSPECTWQGALPDSGLCSAPAGYLANIQGRNVLSVCAGFGNVARCLCLEPFQTDTELRLS